MQCGGISREKNMALFRRMCGWLVCGRGLAFVGWLHPLYMQNTLRFFLKVRWRVISPLSLPLSLFRVRLRLVYLVTWHFDLNTRANQGERNQASNWVNEFNCGLPSWSSVISCLSQRRVMGADTLWTQKARRGPPGTEGELGGSHQG